jgi:hypothetical protein
LFSGLPVVSESFVGTAGAVTNPISTYLLDLCGNPFGTFNQQEPCIYCGSKFEIPPPDRSFVRKLVRKLAAAINKVQALFIPTRPNWIHLVFSKDANG